MILTNESGAQEDQFDGKKEGQKSRGTIPLNRVALSFSNRPIVHRAALSFPTKLTSCTLVIPY
jgi:hypothetical protein